MRDVILNIQQTLQTTIPAAQYIDEDWGQLDYYSSRPPMKWPVYLIDVAAADYSNIGRDRQRTPENRQMGTSVVTITVANLKLSNTSAKAPAGQKNDAFSIWDLIEQAHIKLHGHSPAEYCGKLMRTGIRRIRRDDGIQEYRMTYSMSLDNV